MNKYILQSKLNMRKLILSAILLAAGTFTLSAQDYIDIIAEKSCTCLTQIDTTASQDEINTQLGLCMIQASTPFEKDLKKKAHIDLNQLDNEAGEQLGQLIAPKMLLKCPTLMMRLIHATTKEKDKTAESPKVSTCTGKITDIQSGQFVSITVKSAEGPDQKLYWFEYFKGSELLKDGVAGIKNKTVEVTYTEDEFYNPAIKDYMKYKIITGLAIK